MAPVRHVPTRSCVVCRTSRPKRELVRVVRRPDGSVVLDDTGRVAGRGAYVCRQERCLSEALSKGRLGRALSVAIPSEIRDGLAADLAALEPLDTNVMNDDEGGAGGKE